MRYEQNLLAFEIRYLLPKKSRFAIYRFIAVNNEKAKGASFTFTMPVSIKKS